MIKHFKVTLLFSMFFPLIFFAQDKEQIDLSIVNPSSNLNLQNKWIKYGKGYSVSLDSLVSGNAILIKKDDSSVHSSQDNCIVNYTIPNSFYGKELKIKGQLKLDGVSEGNVGLFIVVLGPNGTLAYEDMLSQKVNGTRDWSSYESSVPYDSENASEIRIGVLHNGVGKVWAKDINLFLDDKPINDAKVKVFPAELDREFDDLNSGVQFEKLSDFQLKGLKQLGLIWGLIKYHHPNIAKGNFNLDYELFRIIKKITTAENEQVRDKIFIDWLNSFGKIDVINKDNLPKEVDIKLSPDFSWINESNFSKFLNTKLFDIVQAEKPGFNYYVELSAGSAKNPVFKNEKDYSKLTYPDQGFQILGLFRLWNIVQYYFPYRYAIDGDWKEVLEQYIPKIINAQTELDYKLIMLEVIGKISDSHAQIRSKEDVLDEFWGKNVPGAIFNFIEDKLVVTGFYEIDRMEKDNLKIGDVILKINGVDIDKIVEEKLKYSPGSNYDVQLRELAINIVRTNDNILNVDFQRDDSKANTSLKTYPISQKMVYSRFRTKSDEASFTMIRDDIAYLNLGTLKIDSLPKIFEEIKNTEGLIIDIRNYPREFFPFSLGSYLVPKPTEFVKFTHPSIEKPGLFSFTDATSVGQENPDYYKGKVIILVNEQTQSASEYTVMALSKAPNSMTLGSQTSGADGNISRFSLPGGISTMITGMGVYYPNGDETQRIGIKIDKVIKPSINGIKNGKDELIEEAIKIIENQ